MAAFDYAEAAADAAELIEEFGQSATLRQVSNGTDPWNPSETVTDTTITAVDLNREIRDASGTLTGQTRRTLYISTAAGVVPAKGDRVAIGGTEHEIAAVRTLAPAGVNVYHEADLIN